MIPLIYFGFRETPIKPRLIFESMSGPVFAVMVAGISTYIFIVFYSKDNITKHILTGIIFFVIYSVITLKRPKTRETLRSILESIVSKQKWNSPGY
jgi:hypothetical protein